MIISEICLRLKHLFQFIEKKFENLNQDSNFDETRMIQHLFDEQHEQLKHRFEAATES